MASPASGASGAEGVEVIFLGRATTTFTGQGLDVLFFSTPDHASILPVWVDPPADLGGRPTDAEILAQVMSTGLSDQPWYAELVTNSRGQITAGIKQTIEQPVIDADEEEYSERYIDIRPSTVEPLWHAGVIFDIRLHDSVASALIEVNPEWTRQLAAAVSAVDEDGDPIECELHWNAEDMGFTVSADPETGFQELWEGLGLSSELDDWLANPDLDDNGRGGDRDSDTDPDR